MPRTDLVIHSGGQTGVDRAALDAALAAAVPIGGWCPRGRRAEDGPIPPRYPLRETSSEDYAERTAWNVRDSDATLVLTRGTPNDGTVLTVDRALALGKPLLVVDMASTTTAQDVAEWLEQHRVAVLNVAGPRESSIPGVYGVAHAFVTKMLGCLATDQQRPVREGQIGPES